MYKNFIFDLYGTLIDIRTDEWSDSVWDRYARWLTDKGMRYTGSEVRKLYNAEVKLAEAIPTSYAVREIDVLPVFDTICRNKKPSVTEEEVWEAGENFRIISTNMIQLYPNTLKVLKGLKAAGKKIYLLSNAQRVFTWQELERTGIMEYFDDIFISSDNGCKKPYIDIINRLNKKHKPNIHEHVMIGNDSPYDIACANGVGMDSLYVRTAISPENDPVPDCKYVFEDGDIGHVLELI